MYHCELDRCPNSFFQFNFHSGNSYQSWCCTIKANVNITVLVLLISSKRPKQAKFGYSILGISFCLKSF